MLKNTHIELSTTLVLIFIFLTFSVLSVFGGGVFPIYAFLLLPILAVLPDSDHPESYLNKKFPILKGLSKVGSHRTWSHDFGTIFLLSGLLYFLFGKIFGHYDYVLHIQDGMNIFQKGIEYGKFLIFSPNFLGIFIVMFGHTFGDFLTKGSIKFFWWCEYLVTTFGKNKILKYTILLPFTLLFFFQTIINKIKGNIFPTTGSVFERNIYASIFNIANFSLLGILLFSFGLNTSIENSIANIAGNGKTLNPIFLLYFFGFFGISMWYFFSLSLEKLGKYMKTGAGILKFIIFETILLLGSYFLYLYLGNQYGLIFLGVILALTIVLYRKFIKLEFDYLNIVLNECLLIIIYLLLSFFLIKSTIVPVKINTEKIHKEINIEKVKDSIFEIKDEITKKIDKNNNKDGKTKKGGKKIEKKENKDTKIDSIFDENDF